MTVAACDRFLSVPHPVPNDPHPAPDTVPVKIQLSQALDFVWHTDKRIRTNLITGFLGTGKSTAIRDLLNYRPESERWSVFVNEVRHGFDRRTDVRSPNARD